MSHDMIPIPLDDEKELIEEQDGTLAGFVDQEPVVNLEAAESSLEKIAYWQAVMKRDEEIARVRMDKIQLWLSRRAEMVQKKIDWHQHIITEYMKVTNTRKLDLPSGKVNTTKGRKRVEIVDEGDFMRWAEERGEPGYIPFMLPPKEPKPDKKQIMEYIKETGEEPPGVELVTSGDKVNFKPGAVKEIATEQEFFEEDDYDGQPTEQQENEDFAQDDDWHNLSASDIL